MVRVSDLTVHLLHWGSALLLGAPLRLLIQLLALQERLVKCFPTLHKRHAYILQHPQPTVIQLVIRQGKFRKPETNPLQKTTVL